MKVRQGGDCLECALVLTGGIDGIHVDMERLKKGEVKYVGPPARSPDSEEAY